MSNLKIALAVVCIFTSFSTAVTFDQVGTRQRTLRTYGGAEVAKVGQVEDVYSFRCDIKGWPAVIGSDISIRIAGLQLPDIVTQQGGQNKFFQQQTIKFLTSFLKNTKKIELANIRRGEYFSLVADVITDSNSLAEILIKKGLAKKAEKSKLAKKPRVPKIIKSQANIPQEKQPAIPKNIVWVASSNSKIFHTSNCSFAKRMKKSTTIQFPTRQKAIETGRRPCKTCKP